jgi:hypothetical protein
MTLHASHLRDPQALMAELTARMPLIDDTALLLLVAHPATSQELVAVQELTTPAVIAHWAPARDELRERVNGLGIPYEPGPPAHLLATVVVRSGLCVFGPNENRWFRAWRYSNHLAHAYDGGLILVTQHGWHDFSSDRAGLSPALVA